MSELSTSGLLTVAVLASATGMGWLALSMPAHAQQVWGRVPSTLASRTLRVLGGLGVMLALALFLAADHATMAVLVWIMSLTGAALAVALVLSWRPGWLRMLAPWTRTGN